MILRDFDLKKTETVRSLGRQLDDHRKILAKTV